MNSTITSHMLGRKCDLKTHVRNVRYPPQIGAPEPLFSTTSNLRANLTAYIFGSKHDIDNRVSGSATIRGLLCRLITT